MVTIKVSIPDELHKKLKHIAIDEGKTLKAIVIEALTKYVSERRKPKFNVRDAVAKLGFTTLSELIKTGMVESPEELISKAISEGVRVFETPQGDYVLVDPDLWHRFEKEVLNSHKDPDEVNDDKLRSLLEMLHRNAIVYLDLEDGWRPV